MNQTREYTVHGMTCSHCVLSVREEVSEVAGVTDVEVDIAAKQVTVTGAFDDTQVRGAIDDAGYDVA